MINDEVEAIEVRAAPNSTYYIKVENAGDMVRLSDHFLRQAKALSDDVAAAEEIAGEVDYINKNVATVDAVGWKPDIEAIVLPSPGELRMKRGVAARHHLLFGKRLPGSRSGPHVPAVAPQPAPPAQLAILKPRRSNRNFKTAPRRSKQLA